jgi:hypothetical protein
VLAEISLVEGSWAKRRYFTELLKTPSLDPRTVQLALTQAGKEVDSDYELASLLIETGNRVTDEATRRAYLDAARTIDSDYEMRRVFTSFLTLAPSTSGSLAPMLDASTAIESDYELAEVLSAAANQPLDGAARAAFFKACATIGSAYEQRRVLTAVLKPRSVSAETLVSVLEAAATINSDYESATVLQQVVDGYPVEGTARAPFFRAASGLESAHERGKVLQGLARRSDISEETLLEIIRCAGTMNSGFEKSQVLLSVASSHQLTRQARDAYIDAAGKLGDYEQGRVLSALVKNERRQ